MPEGFVAAWDRYHAGFRPVGFMLRNAGAKYWLRFHSLPGSKRYAETPAEQQLLLSRQNAIAADVLSEATCWLVQTQWVTPEGATDVAQGGDPFRASREHGLKAAFQFEEAENEGQWWSVRAGQTSWVAGKFDAVLTSIAEDYAAPTLWMAAANGAIFAPYDGGVDLFLPTAAEAVALKDRYPDWLSVHPSGL